MRGTSASSSSIEHGDSRVPRPAAGMMGGMDMRATTFGGPKGPKFATLDGTIAHHAPDHPDWTVDVPLRLRGRSRRGAPDVALEFVRVDIGTERPPGTPARDAVWPRTLQSQSLVCRAVDLCETALVVACLGAADPHGPGAHLSTALAAGGAARAATFALAARRRAVNGTDAPRRASCHVGWTKHATDPGALIARLCDAAFALHVSGAALKVTAPETHHAVKSAAALAGVRVAFSQPTRRRKRRANGNQTRVAEAGQGDGIILNTQNVPDLPSSGVDVSAWHARYRWSALRLAPLVPPQPRAPKFKNAIATLAGVAIAVTNCPYAEDGTVSFGTTSGDTTLAAVSSVGGVRPYGFCKRLDVSWRGRSGKNTRKKSTPERRDGRWGRSSWATRGDAHGLDLRVPDGTVSFGTTSGDTTLAAVSSVGGVRPYGFCKRLDVSWRGRSGKNTRKKSTPERRDGRWGRSSWATRGDAHGLDLRVPFENLGNVTCAEILAPAVAEPPSTSSSARSSPVRYRGRNGDSDGRQESDSDASSRNADGDTAARGGGRSDGGVPFWISNQSAGAIASSDVVATALASDQDASAADGDIWRDPNFDGVGASAFELSARALYLFLAFTPVFCVAMPLLMLAESELLRYVSGGGSRTGDTGDSQTLTLRRAYLRRRAFAFLHFSVSLCGAALVKWAQWASVRRDVFPSDFCDAMGHFHDDAPQHGFRQTEREIRKHLGVPISKIFSHFPKTPVASGSVAQVYRAVLRPEVATACAARDPEFARRVAVDQRRHRRIEENARAVQARAGRGGQRSVAVGAGGSAARRSRSFWRRLFKSSDGEAADVLVAPLSDGVSPATTETSHSTEHSALADLSARTVAVKVRHPNVARQIFLDFQILKSAARLVSNVPALQGLNLQETLSQFSHTMTSQTDLRVEAFNLRKFGRNFRNVEQVLAPWPVVGLVEEGVLCETFERGEALSSAIRRGCEDNTTTCALGVDTYLKMLLRDNFLHSDLHPGNILYHRETEGALSGSTDKNSSQAQLTARSLKAVKLVLLDFGIADSLPVDVRDRFLTFLFSLARQDGVSAANSLLTWSSAQTCVGPEADMLREDVKELVNSRCNLQKHSVDIDDVLKSVMVLLRKRNVAIDAVFASLVVSMCVLVGFATALDEELNLFEVAISAFLSWSVTGDVVGKLYA